MKRNNQNYSKIATSVLKIHLYSDIYLNSPKKKEKMNFLYEVLIFFKNKLTTDSLNNKHP